MELSKDPIWEVFTGAETFESFQKNILEPVYLKEQVPQDIKKEVALAEKLLLHSYFEYHFIDQALSLAVFTFEKSLRIRYREINNKASDKIPLVKLIDWFFDNSFFETSNKDILNQLRYIRNGKVHGEQNSLGGIVFLRKVYSVFYLINDLYEDIDLRKIRKEAVSTWQPICNDFLKAGGIITLNGKRIIIFKADIVFLNNKPSPSILTIVIWPIFELTPYQQNKNIKPYSFEIEITDWEIIDGVFTAYSTLERKQVSISQISDQTNIDKFTKWQTDFYALKNFQLVLFRTFELNDNFYSSLRKFHEVS
jgi:hypothetical protein